MNVEESIEQGICLCCGGKISSKITDKHIINWFCSGEKFGDPCPNYTKEKCNKTICKLNDSRVEKKREEYRDWIKNAIFKILKTEGVCVITIQDELLMGLREFVKEHQGEYYMYDYTKKDVPCIILKNRM